MGEYVRQRLLLFVPTLLGMTILSFALGFLSPSDPALVVLTLDGTSAPTAVELALTHDYQKFMVADGKDTTQIGRASCRERV